MHSEPPPPAAAATDPAGPDPGRDPGHGLGHERRLHPLSWLFVLLEQLKGLALPLLVLLLFGRSRDSDALIWGLLAVAAVTLFSLLQYFSFRFRINAGELELRSGLLQRNVRHVPLARIQSVTLHRNLLHRLAQVAEVRLESAVGGSAPEALMRVLSMSDALALERLVEQHRSQALGAAAAVPACNGVGNGSGNGSGNGAGSAATAAGTPPTLLLRLPLSELVKLGLSSNRGLILAAAALGALAQLGGEALLQRLLQWPRQSLQWLLGQGLHISGWLLLGLFALLAALLASRLLGVALTLLRDFDFTLEQAGPRLSVERGLLTRVRASAPLRRIQRWTLQDTPLLRLFGRRSLKVDTAASRRGNEEQSLSQLIPIASPQQIDALLGQWLPHWPQALHFHPIHPRAWRRVCLPPCLLTLAAAALLGRMLGPAGLWPLALIPLWILIARRQAAACGYALSGSFLFWRSGWLNRRISFAPLAKLQGLTLRQSPFDRRHRMARLHADTAGAHLFGHRLHLIHLPEAEARALYRRLSIHLAQSPWQW